VSELVISDLRAAVSGREILHGLSLTVRSGEVHAIMGPNGAGKSTLSHVLMGKPGYELLAGSVTIDGVELLGLPTWQRAAHGLHLVMQYPTEVPGVRLDATMAEALRGRGRSTDALDATLTDEAARIGFDARFLERPLNVDLSGGEKKRNETLQLGVLAPAFAILDELDSGLDIDALGACARRVEAATREDALGVIAITHYHRLLTELHADVVHILVQGRIVESGGPELATRLEAEGYGAFATPDAPVAAGTSSLDDLFGDMGR
jgi:Fe-S cluster assembly ATP-binding protein